MLALFLTSLVVRLFNAFTIRTYFQPDEYFQALEPAHKLVYGYGHITWEWHEHLRSAMHPLLYAGAYWLMKTILPESMETVGVDVAPKIVGALIAAIGDAYTFRFAHAYTLDARIAHTAWILSLCSGWNWYVATRSFSNNFELVLTTVGLSFWPWHRFRLMSVLMLSFFGFWSCIVRPTNCILWGYLGGILIVKNFGKASRIMRLAVSLGAVLGAVVMLSATADHFYYGEWTFPAVNFLEFNVVKSLLVFYGTAPWHFYLFQGLPIMLMGYLPLFVRALYTFRCTTLVGLVAVVTGAFSAIAHKEFRFLQPVYPVMLVLCSMQLSRWNKVRRWFLVGVLILHGFAAYFFTRVNEVGEIDAVRYLRDNPSVESVAFLTPCHSTPWHSMLHRPDLVGHSWFLTCEPPLHMSDAEIIALYRDELDRFFDDPDKFLRELGPPATWASHVVVFEPMEAVVAQYLGPEYRQCERFFNSYFHWDPRRRGDIIMFCREK